MLELRDFDAAIFDLDGVVTRTARVHAAAWKRLFDDYLRNRAAQTGTPFHPFDSVNDYRDHVDGKPRSAGVSGFFTSRGITIPYGDPSDPADCDTVCGLGNRKNAMFLEALRAHGAEVFPSTIALVVLLRSLGTKTAMVTASENGREILHAAGATRLFDVTVDGCDARALRLRGKPHPDTFLRAAALLHSRPQRAVVCEDALAGVEAAHAGHFGLVVGIDRAGRAEALRARGGNVVVPDLAELGVRDADGVVWRSARALPSALRHFEAVAARCVHTPVAVFLDYDGTLTPIADRPELAVLSQTVRDILDRLSRQCPVGIISGRDRRQVAALVNLPSLIYAGSHGFDIAGPEHLDLHREVGAQYSSTLDRAEDALRRHVRHIPGSLIERKLFSIAAHYRLVDPDNVPRVEDAVARVAADFPALRRSAGKKVFEIQPRFEWDKGKALVWMLDALHRRGTPYAPVYLGDDLTDEDVFRALGERGVGLVVESGYRFSSASYALETPDEARHFLAQLSRRLESPGS